MPDFLFDTDTCIYWLKGNQAIESKIRKTGLRNIGTSVITACELYYGAYKSGRVSANLAVVKELAGKIEVVNMAAGVPALYGRIKSELEQKGRSLDDADLIIACICLDSGATLVTNNTRHFKNVPGLALQNWAT